MNFYQTLRQIYFADPCKVLSLPLWKIYPEGDESEFELRTATDGTVEHIEAWTEDQLTLYWDRENLWRPAAPQALLDNPALAVIHSQYAANLRHSSNQTAQRFFRLRLEHPSEPFPLEARFAFAPVQLPGEARLVSQAIGRCYAHIWPTLEDVMRWIQQPVFDENLWVWIVDRRANQPAALGIAEFDRVEGEAALEWIQVIPEYRGQGVGKALVSELLARLHGKARLVTVSGEADNPSDPEHLYRRCGFMGSDVWWVIRQLGI